MSVLPAHRRSGRYALATSPPESSQALSRIAHRSFFTASRLAFVALAFALRSIGKASTTGINGGGSDGSDVPVCMRMYLSLGIAAVQYPSHHDASEGHCGDINSAFIDASHTAQMFFAPITPGVKLLADSDHDNSLNAVTPGAPMPVPEPVPATWRLMLSGFGTLLDALRLTRMA